jgi:hypothetical protein
MMGDDGGGGFLELKFELGFFFVYYLADLVGTVGRVPIQVFGHYQQLRVSQPGHGQLTQRGHG